MPYIIESKEPQEEVIQLIDTTLRQMESCTKAMYAARKAIQRCNEAVQAARQLQAEMDKFNQRRPEHSND